MLSKKPGFPGFFALRLSIGFFLTGLWGANAGARLLLAVRKLRDHHGPPERRLWTWNLWLTPKVRQNPTTVLRTSR